MGRPQHLLPSAAIGTKTFAHGPNGLCVGWTPGAAGRPRPVLGARRGAEPTRRRARRRGSRHPLSAGLRPRRRRGRLRAGDRLDDGQPLHEDRADRAWRAAPVLRPPRHGAPDRRDRAGGRGRDRPECRGHDPRCRQQGRRRRDARGDAPDPRRAPSARRDRAALHPEGGGRPRRCLCVRPHPPARPDGLRLRPGCADRSRHPRGTVFAVARGDLPRARSALGHASRRRPVGDRGSRPRHLGAPPRTYRCGLHRERRDDLGRHRDEHRSGVVHVRCGGAFAGRAQAGRSDPGDAGCDHVRGRRRGVRRRDEGAEELPRLSLRQGRPRGRACGGRAGEARA